MKEDAILQEIKGINQRLDGVNQRFDEVNKRIDGVNQKMEEGFAEIQEERLPGLCPFCGSDAGRQVV